MKRRLGNLTSWLMAFAFAVAVIIVYKTFDNFEQIWGFLANVMEILTPFVIGFGLAFLLYGPCNFLEKQFRKRKIPVITKHARGTSILVVYLVLLGILALLLTFALPALIRSVTDFVNMLIKDLPSLYNQLMEWLDKYTASGGMLEGIDVEGKLRELYNYILSNVTADKVLRSLSGVLSFTFSLLNIFMAIIVSVYMLASRESLFRSIKTLLSLFMKPRWMKKLSGYAHKTSAIFYRYLYSTFLDACFVAVLASVGLTVISMIFDNALPNSVLLGILIGLMNMIPYFGAIFAGVFCVFVALISGGLLEAVVVAIFVLAMQQVDSNIIQPRIISFSIGVRPIYVLLAITVGGGLFGFWGIFFGVPVMATLQMLVGDFIAYRNRKLAAVPPDGTAEAPCPEEGDDGGSPEEDKS